MTLTANFPFSLVESQSTKLKERFESVGKGHEFAAGLPGGSTQADSAENNGASSNGRAAVLQTADAGSIPAAPTRRKAIVFEGT